MASVSMNKELKLQRAKQSELREKLKSVDVESEAYDRIYAELNYVNDIIMILRKKK